MQKFGLSIWICDFPLHRLLLPPPDILIFIVTILLTYSFLETQATEFIFSLLWWSVYPLAIVLSFVVPGLSFFIPFLFGCGVGTLLFFLDVKIMKGNAVVFIMLIFTVVLMFYSVYSANATLKHKRIYVLFTRIDVNKKYEAGLIVETNNGIFVENKIEHNDKIYGSYTFIPYSAIGSLSINQAYVYLLDSPRAFELSSKQDHDLKIKRDVTAKGFWW